METKTALRQKAVKLRQSLSDSLRREKSRLIQKKLETTPEFIKAEHVLLYYPMRSEVDTSEIIKRYINDKQLYLPVLEDDGIFHAEPIRHPLRLKRGREGVQEPEESKEKTSEKDLDLIIIPGVAFDKDGSRLGMGKGYYDRYLKNFPGITRIALAFQEQIFEKVPKESYDEPVDIIITDRRIYDGRKA